MELVGVEQFAGEFTALGSKGWYNVIPLADRTKDTSTNNYFSELSLTFGRVCYTLVCAAYSAGAPNFLCLAFYTDSYAHYFYLEHSLLSENGGC